MMSDFPRVFVWLVAGVLSAPLIAPQMASAQAAGETTWAALDVIAAINTAIAQSPGSNELREKAVRRISECSLAYGGLSTFTSNVEARKSYVKAQEATAEVEIAISKPLDPAKRLELEQTAHRSIAYLLRNVKAQGPKEIAPLLKSCKALNDVKEIKGALRELASQ